MFSLEKIENYAASAVSEYNQGRMKTAVFRTGRMPGKVL